MLHTQLLPDRFARRHRKPARPLAHSVYDLHGSGIWVGYFPNGFESARGTRSARLMYRDAHGMRTYGPKEIETTEVPGVGTVVTVLLSRTVDLVESLSLILPAVESSHVVGLPASLRTLAVRTVRHEGGHPTGAPQRQMYAVTALTGHALSEEDTIK
jgi:hypothetical protein